MVNLIMRPKGTGKTKTLLELVKQATEQEDGSVVCIEKGKNLTFDVPYTARLIHATDYNFGSFEFFKGFISGLHAANYDITHVFIDNLYKMFDEKIDIKSLGNILLALDEFGEKEGVKFTVTASGDPETADEIVKKHLI